MLEPGLYCYCYVTCLNKSNFLINVEAILDVVNLFCLMLLKLKFTQLKLFDTEVIV